MSTPFELKKGLSAEQLLSFVPFSECTIPKDAIVVIKNCEQMEFVLISNNLSTISNICYK